MIEIEIVEASATRLHERRDAKKKKDERRVPVATVESIAIHVIGPGAGGRVRWAGLRVRRGWAR